MPNFASGSPHQIHIPSQFCLSGVLASFLRICIYNAYCSLFFVSADSVLGLEFFKFRFVADDCAFYMLERHAVIHKASITTIIKPLPSNLWL